jgi:hypothetical protein
LATALAVTLFFVTGCAGVVGTTPTAPTIATQPANQTVLAGNSATFSVVAGGASPLSYQWQQNGAAISGATSASYTTPPTTTAENDTLFQVEVTNPAGSITSGAAQLVVSPVPMAPTVTTQPASQTVMAGQTATFSVVASGTQPLTYQWEMNGWVIEGATSPSYTTQATTTAQSGSSFVVVVSNSAGTALSNPAMLTVYPDPVPPSISTQPANQSVLAGQSATFSVVASGTPPLNYQWQSNGAAISGATAATYATPATTMANNGSTFDVVVTDIAGNTTSNSATLTVSADTVAPTITTQPVSQTVTAGQTVTFSVVATGTPPLNYQWFLDGVVIAGATSPIYTTGAATTASNGSTYNVIVSNVAGSTPSNNVTLTVLPGAMAPTITTQPASATVTAGQAATFSVVASGTQPLSYQWQMNGAAIAGATSSSYTTPATTTANSGSTFNVVVSNSAGTVTSNSATLTVNAAAVAPTITSQPASITVTAGQTATFSVVAAGTQPLAYQWYLNGVVITGANSATYTTGAANTASTGSLYDVVVSNSVGSITSNSATLTVNAAAAAPTITTQPASVTVTAGQTATFTVVASGTQPLSYQWAMNGSAISGATSASYTTPATTSANNGSTFAVTVSNSAGNITSNSATLTVDSAPSITTQPANQTVNVGQTATFSVVAAGTQPLNYQWQENGSNIAGATTASYTTPATTAADNASTFRVVVSNAAGNVASNSATLTVIVPPSITTQPVSVTVTAGQAATFSVVAAGSSPLSYQWQMNGTNINGAIAATYTTPATTTSNSGETFDVVVTNPAGTATSSAVSLTVNPGTTPPPSAIAFVQGAYATPQSDVTSVAATFTSAQSSGGLNLVFVGWNDTTFAVSSVADTMGNTYSLASGPTQLSGETTQAVYYATNIATAGAGANTVTVTFNGGAAYPDLRILEYSGASEATPIDGNGSGTGTSATASASVTTANANDVVVAGDYVQTGSLTPGTGFTSRILTDPDNDLVEDESVSTAGTYTATAPLSSTGWWVMNVVGLTSASTTGAQPPSAPSNLSATAASSTQINLSWTASTDTSGTITSYLVEQCQGAGCTTFAQVGTTNGSTTSYSATGLTASTSYTYRVRASDSNGNLSAYSNTASATTSAAPGPTVSITSPASGATESGTITVSVSASDSAGITSVQLQVDGANSGSPDTASPYTFSLNAANLTNGTHSLTAVASAADGTQATSAPVSITVSNSTGITVTGPLVVCTTNPRYFCNPSGKVVLLGGSHTWADLQNQGTPAPATFDYTGWISFLQGRGHNFFHMWQWYFPNGGTANEAPIEYSGPNFIWVRAGPGTANDGGLQFDFTQLNQTYFDTMRSRIIQAGQAGMYVSIYLFNGYEWQFDVNSQDGNPFESSNNVNGVNCPNTCPTDNSLITAQAWTYEQQYLSMLINTVNDLPNVLYAVSNESPSPGSDTWQASVISYVRSVEAALPYQHPVGMVFQFKGGTDQNLYNSAANWVSPAFGGGGLNVPTDATGQCPTQTGNGGATNPNSPNCKVVINDTDHDCGICGSQAWVWENFTRGNGTLFMDQYLVYAPSSEYSGYNNNPGPPCTDNQCTTVDTQWDPTRNAIGDILNFGNTQIDLVNMTPQDSLASEGFCLANPGSQYLVYSPSGSFTLTTAAGTYTYEWFNPSTHAVISTGSIAVGTSQSFTAPFSGDAVLWLHQ